MTIATHRRGRKGIKVSIYDPVDGHSFNLTVYPGASDAETVARFVESELRSRWDVTSLNDRRHKRR